MVQVVLWGSLKAAAGGQTALEVEASTLRQLLENLGAAHPRLKPVLDKGVSVSIDGRIYNDSWAQTIMPDSEVYILPRIEGG